MVLNYLSSSTVQISRLSTSPTIIISFASQIALSTAKVSEVSNANHFFAHSIRTWYPKLISANIDFALNIFCNSTSLWYCTSIIQIMSYRRGKLICNWSTYFIVRLLSRRCFKTDFRVCTNCFAYEVSSISFKTFRETKQLSEV